MDVDNAYGTFASTSSKESNDSSNVDIDYSPSAVHNVLHHSCSADDTQQSEQHEPFRKSIGLSSIDAAKILLVHG